MPKFHFGTPSDCQLKNEGCRLRYLILYSRSFAPDVHTLSITELATQLHIPETDVVRQIIMLT
ncbi:MAG: hypothetical protein GY795_36475 [Desulfobacterales bacterium]|nr:hypothetical protein [Desulfobacterales bacterium]